MTDLLFWAFTVAGLTYLVTESGILAAPRIWLASLDDWLSSLLYCRMCTGFWCGVVAGKFGLFDRGTGWDPLWSGLAAMGLMWLVQGHMATHVSWEDEFAAINSIRDLAKRKKASRKKTT